MPSLVAFGRRWNISSDDFVFPAITEAVFRFAWVCVAGALFTLHRPSECKSVEWLVYLFMLLVGNVITIALCIGIAISSSRGSILEVNARKAVVKLLYVRVPIFVGEVIYTIVTAVFAFGLLHIDECFSETALRITVALELFLIICVIVGLVLVFNPHEEHHLERSFMIERNYWSHRLALCKIWQPGEMREALDEIATLIAAFFADTDFVLSDIVAGLLLLVHSPEQPPPPLNIRPCMNNLPHWMRIPESLPMICRALEFATAVYGWPTYMFNNRGCSSWCRLWQKTRCCGCCCCKRKVANVLEDNCMSCHMGAFVLESGINETDIFFASFRNRLYQVPFVVLVDNGSNSIVITIRGSASLMDLVTDLSLNEDIFSVDVDSDPILREDRELDQEGEVRVHRGMLNSARFVYNTLKKNRILEELMGMNPGYQLVICGHSLGAGVASLLTLLLKQTYPDIRCYAFSPPGCVVSKHGIAETESHVLSVILGDDLVPRISYQSLMNLKYAIDNQLYTTNRAKYEILIKGIFKLFFSTPWDLHSDNGAPSTSRSCRRLIDNRDNYGTPADADDTASTAEILLEPRTRLYPPGMILHITATDTDIQTNWITHEYLSEIQLTGAIIADHLPYRVRRVMRRLRDDNVIV